MQDINKPIRDAFYNLFNGVITYKGFTVPFCDEVLKSTINAKYYVLLKNQTCVEDRTKQSFDAQATITLDICTLSGHSVSHDACDNIAGQILTILFPTPSTHSLPAPSNWQFLNVLKSDDRPLTLQLSPTESIVRRLLTFAFRVVQN